MEGREFNWEVICPTMFLLKSVAELKGFGDEIEIKEITLEATVGSQAKIIT